MFAEGLNCAHTWLIILQTLVMALYTHSKSRIIKLHCPFNLLNYLSIRSHLSIINCIPYQYTFINIALEYLQKY